jgi:hypothetical protein
VEEGVRKMKLEKDKARKEKRLEMREEGTNRRSKQAMKR